MKTESAKLILGTAQLGLDGYGISNRQPAFDEESAVEFLVQAFDKGVTAVDCAQAYGAAERRVGLALKRSGRTLEIATKLEPFSWEEKSPEEASQLAEDRVNGSLERLGIPAIPLFLLHDWSCRKTSNGAIWNRLLKLRDAGKIKALGASIQTPEEALEALEDRDVQHLQIPFNLFDWRWEKSGFVRALESRKDVTVYVRSVYLQGVVFLNTGWPVLSPELATRIRERLSDLVDSTDRESIGELAFVFACSQKWVDGVVVGVETTRQLQENIKMLEKPRLSDAELCQVAEAFMDLPVSFLNPSCWSHV